LLQAIGNMRKLDAAKSLGGEQSFGAPQVTAEASIGLGCDRAIDLPSRAQDGSSQPVRYALR
jgi:hypothetical protein